MGKTLVIISVVITVLAAGIGFKNRANLQETSSRLEATKESLSKSTTQVAKIEKELKSTKETLQSTTAEKEQVAAQVVAVKGDLSKAKTDLDAVTAKVTEKSAELEAKVAELTAANAKIAENAAKGTGSETKIKELETQVAEAKAINDTLTEQNNGLKGKVTTLTQAAEIRKQLQRKNSFAGRVLAVNQAWNFVVLNLGDRNGVTNNVEMLVKRGNQLVGKVRVTSVEPATSIADIVASNIPGGLSILPNDQVISINEEVKN